MSRPNWNSGQVQGWGADPLELTQGLFPAWNNAHFNPLPNTGSNNAAQGVLGLMSLIRFSVLAPITVSMLAINVTTAGGGSAVFRMGIYAADKYNGRPGSLVVDAGTVSATTTGRKDLSFTQSLQPGIYYVAWVAQDWTGTRPDCRGVLDGLQVVGMPDSDYINFLTNGTATHSVAITGVTGALPNPAGTLSTSSENRRSPMVAIRISV